MSSIGWILLHVERKKLFQVQNQTSAIHFRFKERRALQFQYMNVLWAG
jgi:hypothetical protein